MDAGRAFVLRCARARRRIGHGSPVGTLNASPIELSAQDEHRADPGQTERQEWHVSPIFRRCCVTNRA
jgi:hypothetical protein